MKALFFSVFPTTNAGTRYRLCKYFPYLQNEGMGYKHFPPMPDPLFRFLYQTTNPLKKATYYFLSYLIRCYQILWVWKYDVIFVHQGLSYFGPPVLENLIAKLNPNIVFDTDDAHFAKPTFATGFAARFHDRERVAKLSKLAKQVVVSVDFIKEYAEQYNSNITVIPTSIDLASYQIKDYQKPCGAKVIIGWAGTASGLLYLRELVPVLQRLARHFAIQLKIICSDFIDLEEVEVIQQKWSLRNEVGDLQSLDIGIMPLSNTEFEKGKGGFKLIQYMGVGLPVVCSPVGINVEIVQNGINGFLADSHEEWYEYLSRLIEDPGLRERLGRKGRESIEGKFTIEANTAKFVEVLKQACKNRST